MLFIQADEYTKEYLLRIYRHAYQRRKCGVEATTKMLYIHWYKKDVS